MSESWSREAGSAATKCIGKDGACEETPVKGRRLCKQCRSEQEQERRKRDREHLLALPCGWTEYDCPNPRVVTETSVHSYCLEHKRMSARRSDTARRRAAGVPETVRRDVPVSIPDGMKWCWGCADKDREALLPVDAFHFSPDKKDGRQTRCKQCQKENYEARLKEDPERVREIARNSQKKNRRRRVYNMSPEFEALLLKDLDYRCPLDSKPFLLQSDGRFKFVTDHVKTTGSLRGLLHSTCNTGLGLMNDHDPRTMIAAAIYVTIGYTAIPLALHDLDDAEVHQLLFAINDEVARIVQSRPGVQ